MRCAQCNRKIPTDEETWVQGRALCDACWKRSLRKTWGWTWVVLGVVFGVFLLLFFGVPIFMFCVAGGILGGRGR